MKISGGILFTWFMLASFIFFLAPQRWTNKLQLAFAAVFRFPLSVGRNVCVFARGETSVPTLTSQKKYNMLQNHLANTVAWLQEERQKVERLSGLRSRTPWQGTKFVLADVITASISGPQAKVVINRGTNDALAQGQYVMSDYSIIGTISAVDRRTAVVRLITDRASKIPVTVDQDSFSTEANTEVIMRGAGGNTATIRLLPAKHKINEGSVVYVQKKPGFLSTQTTVGTVAHCKLDDEDPLLWDITVEPACDIENLRDVTVIVMNPAE
jgi:rod shape-determining protein MreC